MGEGYTQGRRRAASVVGVGGSLMTHSNGCVTTQSIALK